jgi:hypothetical protein
MSMKQKIFVLLIIQFLSLNILSQNSLWLKPIGKIKPLVSTEKDVTRVLGIAQERSAEIGEYVTKEGFFTVTYSRGICKSSIIPYQVQAGTVLQYSFRPRKEIVFSKLGINVSNWEISETSDTGQRSITYLNSEKGVNLEVEDNVLTNIDVYPAEDFDYLLCSEYY